MHTRPGEETEASIENIVMANPQTCLQFKERGFLSFVQNLKEMVKMTLKGKSLFLIEFKDNKEQKLNSQSLCLINKNKSSGSQG